MIAPLLTALALAAAPSQSTTWSPTGLTRVTGGVLAPAKLPGGTIAMYGLVGAPELGAGYRQGFDAVELEGRVLFNVFQLAALLEGALKFEAFSSGRLQVAPVVAAGLTFNSGSTYFDRQNFAAVSLRPRVGAVLSWRFTDLVSGLAQLEVPWAIALTVQGHQVTPTATLGAEFHVGGDLSLLVAGTLGVDVIAPPGLDAVARPAWGLRLGLGHRVF